MKKSEKEQIMEYIEQYYPEMLDNPHITYSFKMDDTVLLVTLYYDEYDLLELTFYLRYILTKKDGLFDRYMSSILYHSRLLRTGYQEEIHTIINRGYRMLVSKQLTGRYEKTGRWSNKFVIEVQYEKKRMTAHFSGLLEGLLLEDEKRFKITGRQYDYQTIEEALHKVEEDALTICKEINQFNSGIQQLKEQYDEMVGAMQDEFINSMQNSNSNNKD